MPEDKYIQESYAKIKALNFFVFKDKTVTTEVRNKLRNQASALQSRVNKKLG